MEIGNYVLQNLTEISAQKFAKNEKILQNHVFCKEFLFSVLIIDIACQHPFKHHVQFPDPIDPITIPQNTFVYLLTFFLVSKDATLLDSISFHDSYVLTGLFDQTSD